MQFKIQIDTDNAAFEVAGIPRWIQGCEIARILRDVARGVGHKDMQRGEGDDLRDYNGNVVGSWSLEEGK